MSYVGEKVGCCGCDIQADTKIWLEFCHAEFPYKINAYRSNRRHANWVQVGVWSRWRMLIQMAGLGQESRQWQDWKLLGEGGVSLLLPSLIQLLGTAPGKKWVFPQTEFLPGCVVLLEGIYGCVGDCILCLFLVIFYCAVLKPWIWWLVWTLNIFAVHMSNLWPHRISDGR